jgi:uncharacterized repeat protein (TIGR03803 family)
MRTLSGIVGGLLAACFMSCAVLPNPALAAQETVLFSFPHRPGAGFEPDQQLLLHHGVVLFGTTPGGSCVKNAGLGRERSKLPDARCRKGLVFNYGSAFSLKLERGVWKRRNLHDFGNGQSPVVGPTGGPTRMSRGSFAGVTWAGGEYNLGSVYQLTRTSGGWELQTLYSFAGGTDGENPVGTLARDSSGNLFGVTNAGGQANDGTVFELTKVNGVWTEQVLHRFDPAGGSDGLQPTVGLLFGHSGAIYGVTSQGGAYGQGCVFGLAESNGTWTETVLHDFAFADGSQPEGSLIEGPTGTLYGTTYAGGANAVGVAFQLSYSNAVWHETVLHDFGANGDGAYPFAGLTMDADGSLYGTTIDGGGLGGGTVFRLSPASSGTVETVLHSFGDGADASHPVAKLIRDESSGALYGMSYSGGARGFGTVLELSSH